MTKTPSDTWKDVLQLLKSARIQADLMHNAPRPGDRDLATENYVEAVDLLVAELSGLSDLGTLKDVADLLDVTYGGKA